MAIYVVMAPAGEGEAPEKAVFLRDGFSIAAFVFGPLWLFWNRAYLAASLWLALMTMLAVGGRAFGVRPEATGLLNLALSLALGFEGVRLIIWTLERRGFRQSGIVACDNAEEAEEVFFHNRPAAHPSSPPYSKEEA
jgi:hypothetical protein